MRSITKAALLLEVEALQKALDEERAITTRLRGELMAAVDQQAATSAILRVINRSQADVQPVFDAIVANAMRLCGGRHGTLYRRHGNMVDCVAHHNVTPETQELLRRVFPRPIGVGASPHFHRALLEGTVVSIPDIETDPDLPPRVREVYRAHGMRSVAMVPLVGHPDVLGVLVVGHGDVAAFSEGHMALLHTFADQAVIAIENARLLTELQGKNADLTEALEQQTATSDILRVISSSPTDVQPVFETIVRRAVWLCDGLYGAAARFDGELMHLAAQHNYTPEVRALLPAMYPRRPDRTQLLGRAILTRAVVHIEDILDDPEYPQDVAHAGRWRGALAVPMLRDGVAIGGIFVTREPPGLFSTKQIELLQTFADQAVIALENVRLFTELEARNRELTTALEQQTATSEILRVISSSPTDLEPVLATVARNSALLCGASDAQIYRVDEGFLFRAAAYGLIPASPRRTINRDWVTGRAVVDRRTIHVHDLAEDEDYPVGREFARQTGHHTTLVVPLLREGVALGAILVRRMEVHPFSDTQIKLLETFADQAVIAIDNARLLTELQARTAQLTRSVEELQALGDVSQALSSTLDLDTVLNTIVARANQLARTASCTVYEYDEKAEELVFRATHGLAPAVVEVAQRAPIRRGEGVAGRMAVTLEPVQIGDIAVPGAYRGPQRDVLLGTGTRALLHPAHPRGAPHRRTDGHTGDPGRVPAGSRRRPEDLRGPVGHRHPERPPLP
jgi:GAF domain-containing protein